jgi:hypothetical protein
MAPIGAVQIARADRVGLWLSLGCAAHCAVTPLLAAATPVLHMRSSIHGTAEALFALASVGVAVLNVCWGVQLHRQRRLLLLVGVGVLCIAAGTCLVSAHEVLLVTAGAGGLAVSHILNRRLCLQCARCEHKDHGRIGHHSV